MGGAGGVHADRGRHGGNAATQTLTVIIRGLALGELTWTNSRKALFKNLLVGVGNGLVTGTIAAVVAWIMNGDFRLGIILGLAMVINLFVAGLVGTLIPLGLKALKIDPALASAVFITTFTDVCGFASFLGLASLFTRYFQRAG
jgi:magnesium transporter